MQKAFKYRAPPTHFAPRQSPLCICRACPDSASASTVTSVRYARFLVFDFLVFVFFFFFFLPRFFNTCFVPRCVPNWIWAAFILMPISVCLAHLICRTAQRRDQRERKRMRHTHTQTHRQKTATFQKLEIAQIEFSDFLCSCSLCGLFLSAPARPDSARPPLDPRPALSFLPISSPHCPLSFSLRLPLPSLASLS